MFTQETERMWELTLSSTGNPQKIQVFRTPIYAIVHAFGNL